MTHLEQELTQLRSDLFEMWSLVLKQVKSSRDALINFDKDIAAEIRYKEKMVDAFELKLDRDCENLIALHTPVAVDLRLTLAVLKINTNLERIADFAKSIASFVLYCNKESLNPELLQVTQIRDIFDNAIDMLSETRKALKHENSKMAIQTFVKDDFLDEMNEKSTAIISEYIAKHPEESEEALTLYSIIKKLERIGDHCSNIAEEIVFYMDAKVLKHGGLDHED
ncbi:MAG: phosphate signaling complex protein PhoU [Bacteroidota bacterium]|nr:phosphate signaling complex protein PhoU [Bacteroidota bacterium]MDP4205119.1 phosphate signaling complex protein PhoU [Bacteroidota bacterium]